MELKTEQETATQSHKQQIALVADRIGKNSGKQTIHTKKAWNNK